MGLMLAVTIQTSDANSTAHLIYPIGSDDLLIFEETSGNLKLISAPEVEIPANIHLGSFWYVPEEVSKIDVFCTF